VRRDEEGPSVNILAVMPLAVVMIAGPQIISSFFFATGEKWRLDSVAYILGAAAGLFVVVTIVYLVANRITSGGSESESGSRTLDYVIVGLLVLAMAYVFHRRKRTEPPKWMGKLQTATPRFAFILGFLLLGFFPSDILTSIAVGAHLANHGETWLSAGPFIFLTLLFLALPALAVLTLGQRAGILLPKIRNWMDENSWIVSEIVLVFFIAIVLLG
jgi:Sap, sulfolipid-1-addressing protein